MSACLFILLVLLAAGCAGPSPPPPAPATKSPAAAEDACPAESRDAEGAAARAAGEGRLDEALSLLERAGASCPQASSRLARARAAAEARLAQLPSSLGEIVAEGHRLRASGDEAGAMAAYSKALRVGPGPRGTALFASPLLERGGTDGNGVRLDASTVLIGAHTGEIRGALVVSYARRQGGVTLTPLRMVGSSASPSEAHVAAGPGGRFAVAGPQQSFLIPGPGAPSVPLPGGNTVIFADGGASLVIARVGGVRSFDASSGGPRAGWQPVLLPEPPVLVADPVEPWVSRCPLGLSDGNAFVIDARSGQLLAKAEGTSCALDRARRRMVMVRGAIANAGPQPTWLEIVDLTTGKVVKKLPAPKTEGLELAMINEPSGLVRVPGGRDGRPPDRWVDPLTGKPGKYVGRPRSSERLSGIPLGEADFMTDLSPLEPLAEKPREILPNYHAAQLISWTSNGVRSRDGRWVAVVDHLPSDEGDKQLILADARTLAVRHRVPLPPLGQQWLQVAFMDDAHVTVRFDWTTLVFDVESGTLRASAATFDVGGKVPSWLGDDLASVGGNLLDLSAPRSFEQASDALVAPPLAGVDIDETRALEGLVLTDRRSKRRWVIRPDGRLEAPSGPLPPWLVCSAGEWLMPFEACAHRLRLQPQVSR